MDLLRKRILNWRQRGGHDVLQGLHYPLQDALQVSYQAVIPEVVEDTLSDASVECGERVGGGLTLLSGRRKQRSCSGFLVRDMV